MRKIIVSEFLSLDGVMESPGPDNPNYKHAGWTMPYANDEFMEFKKNELFDADTLLLGRITYEGFAKAWPNMKDPAGFADRMNNLPKYVATTTLELPQWNNSHLIKDNASAEIAKLKQQAGKDILVFGSGILTKTLIQNNLVDEFRLLIYPVVLGSGKKLFKEDAEAKLKLIEARNFKTGVVLLRYSAAIEQ